MKLIVNNIGKVAEAEIELNGITVIGGKNNTGKSTVGKSLFSIFNSFYEIQQRIYNERLLSVKKTLSFLYRNLIFSPYDEIKLANDFARVILDKADQYRAKPKKLKEDIKIVFNLNPKKKTSFISKKEIRKCVNRIVEILNISDIDIFNSITRKIMNAEFHGQLLNIYTNTSGCIRLFIQDQELAINIFEDYVSANRIDYSLHTEAIYIDDPFVLDTINYRVEEKKNINFDHRLYLKKILMTCGRDSSVVDEIVVEKRFQRIYQKLSSVCDGKVVRQNNDSLGYQLNNAERSLDVKNLSTGLKTFVILQTLLYNGSLEENGIVILDEPEIHLHPEWQLLFAELIILLNKEFGIKILLNTHSPYFLRAIQVYAAKYQVADVCKYYLSELKEDGKTYILDTTDQIDKIYEKLSRPLQQLENERWNVD